MQTDPTGNLLTTTKIVEAGAANIRRQVAALVEFNYHLADASHSATVKDTTNWTDGNWTDETASVDLAGLSGTMQIHPLDAGATTTGTIPPSLCTIPLWNWDKTTGKPRFSVNRSDGALYSLLRMDTGAGGLYQLPVNVWMGFYDYPGLTPAASTTVGSPSGATPTVMHFGASINAGTIIRIGSEDLAVLETGVTPRVSRGFNGTTATIYFGGETVTKVGAMTRQFTGIVSLPQGSSKGRTLTLNCLDRTGLVIRNTATVPTGATIIYTDQTPDFVIGKWLDALPTNPVYAPVPSAQRSLDNGIYLIPFAYMDEGNIMGGCAAVAEVDGGICFFNKEGKFQFWNGQHLLGAATQYTFDTSNMGDFTDPIDFLNIYTDVVAQYSARTIGPSQNIYQLTEVLTVPAATTAAYGTPQTLNGAITSLTAGAITVSGTGVANADDIAVDGEQMHVISGGGTVNLKVVRGTAGTGTHVGGTTLSAAVADNLTTTVSVVGTVVQTNETIQIDSEQMFVSAGGGTGTLTVTRGFNSTAAPHHSGATVVRLAGSAHATGAAVTKVSPAILPATILQFQYPSSSVTTPITGPAPVAGTADTRDLIAFTGGGVDIGGWVSISGGGGSWTASAVRANVTVANWNCFSQAIISKLQIRGKTQLGYPAKRISKTKTPIPSSLNKATYQMGGNAYWQDEGQATGVVDMLGDRWKQGRSMYQATRAPAVPMLEPGDKVAFSEPNTLSATMTGFVTMIKWYIDRTPEGLRYLQDITAVDDTNFFQSAAYFVIGTDILTNSKVAWY